MRHGRAPGIHGVHPVIPPIHPDPYILVLTGAGFLIALVAWLPLALRRLPLSLPIVCIAAGAVLSAVPGPLRDLNASPLAYPELTERFAEFVVIIALMGAGLKLDRIFGLWRWAVTWRLILVTLPLSIAAITLLGGTWLGLSWPVALLLAASLAPTDPVLASDVQVGPPKTGEEDEVRFGLTSEAGVNDGAAFPFVHLAIALTAAGATGKPWAVEWLTYNVLWEIGAGVAGGYLIGRAFGWLAFRVSAETKLARTGEGLIALLLLFGAALADGLLRGLVWTDVAAALVILLVIRPVTGLIGLAGHKAEMGEKLTIAFFGIRGVGSIYYLAYGLNHAEIAGGERLWAIAGLVILISILLHGLTVTPVMRLLDRKQGRDPDAEAVPPPGLQGPGGG